MLVFRYLDYKYSVFDKTYQPSAAEITREALAELRRVKGERFFMYLHYMDPHSEYHLHKGFFPANLPDGSDVYSRLVGSGWLADEAAESPDVYNYFTEVGYVDSGIGELLKGIRDMGLRDNTIVVFLADHGEELFDRGHLGHMDNLHNELVKIPLALRYPEQISTGLGRMDLVNTVDVLPTLLDLCGIPVDENMEGRPLFSKDNGKYSDKPFIMQYKNHLFGTISREWKFIHDFNKSKKMLYQAETDIYERNNMADTMVSVADSLTRQLHLLQIELLSKVKGTMDERVINLENNPELREQLKALGYVQ